jgi:NAD(P) transhydrogenase subunit alpha
MAAWRFMHKLIGSGQPGATPGLSGPSIGRKLRFEDIDMDLATTLTGFVALYIFMLAAFTGYEIIGRVPSILHTPLMSGSNFVHGIVVVGAMYALLNATSLVEQIIGFAGVLLGAGNAAGGYVVTERMLEMFKPSDKKTPAGEQKKA